MNPIADTVKNHKPPARSLNQDSPVTAVPYHRLERVFLFLGIVVFAGLRIWYWLDNSEPLVSDMRDFHNIALRIMESFSFEHSPFWQSYKPPMLPLLGAMVFSLTSADNLLAWQIFQTTLQLVCLLWLVAELRRMVTPHWLPAAVLWVVAISRSSIFWTTKFSTECLAETGVYALCAAALHALRLSSGPGRESNRRHLVAWWLFGMIGGLACLNRPNFLPSVVAVAAFAPLVATPRRSAARTIIIWCVVAAGCTFSWSPWMIRTYRLYGVPMIGNTSSGGTLIFNLGEVPFRHPDGSIETVEYYRVHQEAPGRFNNDYEANRFITSVFMQWFWDNPRRYLELYVVRLLHTANRPRSLMSLGIAPRDRCFSPQYGWFGQVVDLMLLDKSWFTILFGYLGLLAHSMAYRQPAMMMLLIVAVPSWLLAIAFQGTPRMIEPIVPAMLVGCTVCWAAVVQRYAPESGQAIAPQS